MRQLFFILPLNTSLLLLWCLLLVTSIMMPFSFCLETTYCLFVLYLQDFRLIRRSPSSSEWVADSSSPEHHLATAAVDTSSSASLSTSSSLDGTGKTGWTVQGEHGHPRGVEGSSSSSTSSAVSGGGTPYRSNVNYGANWKIGGDNDGAWGGKVRC